MGVSETESVGERQLKKRRRLNSHEPMKKQRTRTFQRGNSGESCPLECIIQTDIVGKLTNNTELRPHNMHDDAGSLLAEQEP